MNEQKQYARITRMAMPEDAHLVERIGIVSEDAVIVGNTHSIIVLIDGNTQFVCGGDYELLTMCDCGNYPVKPGLRVCDSCEFARDMYPDLFDDDEPDAIESAAS